MYVVLVHKVKHVDSRRILCTYLWTKKHMHAYYLKIFNFGIESVLVYHYFIKTIIMLIAIYIQEMTHQFCKIAIIIILILLWLIYVPQTNICLSLASSVVDSYPSEPQKYPTFKCLKTVLKGMRNGSFNVHPFTMEMLSSLDKYVKPTTYSNSL